jgi:hypothetical protein
MEELKQKLLKRVNIDLKTNCWMWIGSKGSRGYGRIKVEGKYQSAHRISYLVFKGEFEKGKEIDHLCRNRLCINPSHIEQVTHLINMQRVPKDLRGGNRGGKGYKLNKEQVIEILLLNGKMSKAEIGRKYNVSDVHINHILRGNRWKSIFANNGG